MVDNAEEAQICAREYPPEWNRGVRMGLNQDVKWGADPDYIYMSNSEMCLMVRVETTAGYKYLDNILASPEIDVVFIGPADLSAWWDTWENPIIQKW